MVYGLIGETPLVGGDADHPRAPVAVLQPPDPCAHRSAARRVRPRGRDPVGASPAGARGVARRGPDVPLGSTARPGAVGGRGRGAAAPRGPGAPLRRVPDDGAAHADGRHGGAPRDRTRGRDAVDVALRRLPRLGDRGCRGSAPGARAASRASSLAVALDALAARDRARLRPLVRPRCRRRSRPIAVGVVLVAREASSRPRACSARTRRSATGPARPSTPAGSTRSPGTPFDVAVLGLGLPVLATAALAVASYRARPRSRAPGVRLGRARVSVLLVVQVGLFSA